MGADLATSENPGAGDRPVLGRRAVLFGPCPGWLSGKVVIKGNPTEAGVAPGDGSVSGNIHSRQYDLPLESNPLVVQTALEWPCTHNRGSVSHRQIMTVTPSRAKTVLGRVAGVIGTAGGGGG